MQKETIPLEETDCFSSFFLDYISGKRELAPFYSVAPKLENFREIIEGRNFPTAKRSALVDSLEDQYDGLKMEEAISKNIALLKDDKTYTIVTGHQLNIFTGPLYFIYKIITVINTCQVLKKKFPEYDFVPVYWMASEDHDFEEIQYFHYEGKKVEWKTDQKGAVGRFNPKELVEIAKSLPQGAAFFEEAYTAESLAEAVRRYVNHLFGRDGLVVIDADDPQLKQSLNHVVEEDLFSHSPQKLVSKTSKALEALGFKPQVHPREINFFYLNGDVRERIIASESGFEAISSDIHFSESEMRQLIQSNPEQFSPNVILRPLYQELILPNLAYVGGPSELVYWLQLKDLFDHFKTPFPILLPRNFGLVSSQKNQDKWSKIGLSTKDLFLGSDQAFSKWISKNTQQQIDYQEEVKSLEKIKDAMKAKASKVNPTLEQHVEAIHASFQKKVQKAEKKILRAEKKKHQNTGEQIEAVKESLFPGGTLQERKTNFLNFYLKDPEFIQKLKEEFDPFLFEMNLLSE